MGRVLEPKVWCRSRACREGAGAGEASAEGCTCRRSTLTAQPRPEPRITVLRARAMRLRAFACRACGRAARRMVEWPEMFFRCEECAANGRWVPQAGGA